MGTPVERFNGEHSQEPGDEESRMGRGWNESQDLASSSCWIPGIPQELWSWDMQAALAWRVPSCFSQWPQAGAGGRLSERGTPVAGLAPFSREAGSVEPQQSSLTAPRGKGSGRDTRSRPHTHPIQVGSPQDAVSFPLVPVWEAKDPGLHMSTWRPREEVMKGQQRARARPQAEYPHF